jgi:methanol corrinoid protein
MDIKKELMPQFETEEQETEYWDTHSPLEFVAEPKAQKVRVRGVKDRPITIRLDSESRLKLNKLAAERGLGPSTFARLILTSVIERREKMPQSLENPTLEEARAVDTDPVLQEVGKFVVEGDAEGIVPVVKKALASKGPMEIINDGLIAGMNEVSRLWDEGIYFLPQVILAADAMNAGIALCEEAMGKPMERKGKVLTHTAEGDIHDISQVIANALFNAGGFEVINLGCDYPVDTVVAAVKEHKPILVTGTALMTTTMTSFPKIGHMLESAGKNTSFLSTLLAISGTQVITPEDSDYEKLESIVGRKAK